MRKHRLIALAIGDFLVRVARGLRAALQGDAGVIFPEMLLARHALDRRTLLLPDGGDVEQHVGLPAALLGLMRLEQKDGWRAQHLLAGIVSMRLRDDARVLREIAHSGVIV